LVPDAAGDDTGEIDRCHESTQGNKQSFSSADECRSTPLFLIARGDVPCARSNVHERSSAAMVFVRQRSEHDTKAALVLRFCCAAPRWQHVDESQRISDGLNCNVREGERAKNFAASAPRYGRLVRNLGSRRRVPINCFVRLRFFCAFFGLASCKNPYGIRLDEGREIVSAGKTVTSRAS
jgi:hypothetical protein